jgi:formimidoylglutamate deiminase
LKHQARAVLATEAQSTGRFLHEHASRSAAIALGRKSGCIEVGYYADLAELPHCNPDLEGLTNDMALDSWIFAPNGSSIENLWSAGRHVVKSKVHIKREKIKKDYIETIKKLRSRI